MLHKLQTKMFQEKSSMKNSMYKCDTGPQNHKVYT